MPKMEAKFDPKNEQASGVEESVYVMEVDRSKYDPRVESYRQIHCLRFEIDRTKSKGG